MLLRQGLIYHLTGSSVPDLPSPPLPDKEERSSCLFPAFLDFRILWAPPNTDFCKYMLSFVFYSISLLGCFVCVSRCLCGSQTTTYKITFLSFHLEIKPWLWAFTPHLLSPWKHILGSASSYKAQGALEMTMKARQVGLAPQSCSLEPWALTHCCSDLYSRDCSAES